MSREAGNMRTPPSDELLARYAPLTPVHGCNGLVAHQAKDVYALWEAWEEECGRGREVPFWAVVWPGAAVFARHVLEGGIDVAGRVVLDLGCGGGAPGIAAALAGAREVIANDIDPVALHLTQCNARANNVTVRTEGRDLLKAEHLPGVDVILVADFFYLRNESRVLIELLNKARRRGVLVLIADGGRAFAPKEGIEVLATERVPVDHELEGIGDREVRILRFTD